MSKAVTKKESNPLKKEFDNFFDSPTREKLEKFLQSQHGEQSEVDFKEDWQDYAKTSKHILAIANSGGGCVVVGVKEQSTGKLEAIGLSDFCDSADITNRLKNYLPTSLISNFRILNFDYDDYETENLKGKKFQVIFIEDKPEMLPFVAIKDGEKLREGAIYVRRGTSSTEANYEEIQKVLNNRIETGYSSKAELDLRSHIEQLKILFENTERNYVSYSGGLADLLTMPIGNYLGKKVVTPNDAYPKEDFNHFISRVIEKKKKRIEIDLDVENIPNE